MNDRFSQFIYQQRLRLLAALISTVLIIASIGTYAWFFHQRSLTTLVEVAPPSSLIIKGGNQTDIQEIDLSGIDLSNPLKKHYFVFCVVGASNAPYEIELAHTTNVNFTYTLYTATALDSSSPPSSNTVPYYSAADGNTYYYQLGDNLSTSPPTNITTTDVGKQPAQTYKTGEGSAYTYVHSDADPTYWLASGFTPQLASDGTFCDYYILELSWDDTVSSTASEKETDLVYLLAENVLTEIE